MKETRYSFIAESKKRKIERYPVFGKLKINLNPDGQGTKASQKSINQLTLILN